MKKKVVFCERNLQLGTDKVLNELKKNHADRFQVSTTRCLAACGDCSFQLIADVHGKLVTASSPTELLARILAEES